MEVGGGTSKKKHMGEYLKKTQICSIQDRTMIYNTYIAFIPPRDCESSTEGGPIVFTYVLSPEGTAKAVPKVVQLFLLMFYFWVGNVYWTFKIRIFHRPF